MKVAIVGAGPSGLAAAFHLQELARRQARPLELTIFEATERPGGAIGTDEIDGFLVERGADGFLTDKPALLDLARRLGIEDRLIRTQPTQQGASIVKEGRLFPIPEGFSMMAPTGLRAFLTSPLLSPWGKLRAMSEVLLPRGAPRRDESVASFVRRRFGSEVLERLAQPLIGGIYGADPELLSLRATMPRFLDAERSSRSVTLALRRQATRSSQPAHGARYGLFASFDRGMQVLVDTLVHTLPPAALRLGAPVEEIIPTEQGASLRVGHQWTTVDRVILALSGKASARLLTPIDAPLARRLARIDYGSCALINLGFLQRFPQLTGYGVVVPEVEGRPSLAMTFASRKWAGRASEGRELIRVFLGEQLAEEADDNELLRVAQNELRALLGIDATPHVVVIRRYVEAMPRYHVGHLDRIAALEERAAQHRWLALAGNALRGVGIPDAVRAGELAADRAMA
ncbi:MAG: protoporphyrinogen oxidase [Myxococcales bacterium]|nr:protoporphyrinogen oxidase [Polyangiaceae bacterium]MDW8252021.1 protoporphyrinogen oxidase [Myxococcales bacterium]